MNYTSILIITNLISFAIGVFAGGKFLFNLYKDQIKKNEELKSVLIPTKTHNQSHNKLNKQQNPNQQLATVFNLSDFRK